MRRGRCGLRSSASPIFAGEKRLLVAESAIHQIDTMRYLMGPLVLENAHLGDPEHGLKGEIRCMLMMSVPNGAPVVLVAEFGAHGRPPSQFDHVELLGETGSIRFMNNVARAVRAEA